MKILPKKIAKKISNLPYFSNLPTIYNKIGLVWNTKENKGRWATSRNRKYPLSWRDEERAFSIAVTSAKDWKIIGSKSRNRTMGILTMVGCDENASTRSRGIIFYKNPKLSILFKPTSYLYIGMIEKYLIFSIIFLYIYKNWKTDGGLIVSSPTNIISNKILKWQTTTRHNVDSAS